jgi:hypothetical protein
MPVTDRAQFDWSSLKKRDIDALPKEEQNELRLQRERYNEVFGARRFARDRRGKGTRHAAFAELMDTPRFKAAEEKAALGQLLAPAAGGPQLSRQEKLDDLRARAQRRIDQETGPVDNNPDDLFGHLPLRDAGEQQAPLPSSQAPVVPAQAQAQVARADVNDVRFFPLAGSHLDIEEEEKEA